MTSHKVALHPIIWQLKKHCEETGTSYSEISRLTGVHWNTISSWFRGVNSPKLADLSKVADALGFTVVLWVQPL